MESCSLMINGACWCNISHNSGIVLSHCDVEGAEPDEPIVYTSSIGIDNWLACLIVIFFERPSEHVQLKRDLEFVEGIIYYTWPENTLGVPQEELACIALTM